MSIKKIHILKFSARVLSLVSISFISFFIISHMFGNESASFNSTYEIFEYLFFPLGVLFGLTVAWKWKLVGAIITLFSITMFHILRQELLLDPIIDGLAFPGVLFFGHYLLKSKNSQVESET